MVLVAVFVESWEIECCWPPPAVGESREWNLGLVGGDGGDGGVEGVRVWDGVVEPLAGFGPENGRAPAVVHLDGFDVFWRDRGGRSGPVQVSGRLFHGVHLSAADLVAPSIGTVRGVRVEDRAFSLRPDPAGGEGWYPTGEPARYRPVDVSPKWFDRRLPGGAAARRDEVGVLVEVEITRGGRLRQPTGP